MPRQPRRAGAGQRTGRCDRRSLPRPPVHARSDLPPHLRTLRGLKIGLRARKENLTMPTLSKRNADIVVTMGDESCELLDAGLFVRDGVIEQVGPTEELPRDANVVLSMTGRMLLRGFLNNGKGRATDACMPTPAHSGRQGFSLQ